MLRPRATARRISARPPAATIRNGTVISRIGQSRCSGLPHGAETQGTKQEVSDGLLKTTARAL
jgi:hypothetical protein